MKVEIFGDNKEAVLQEMINKWLEKHPDIRVLFITQSSDGGTEETVGYCMISIWYENTRSGSYEIGKELDKEVLELQG